ncbi:hypothetical protein T439DRAFT_326777, partial [Meredithblackwellia eburnea MCA 4105]
MFRAVTGATKQSSNQLGNLHRVHGPVNQVGSNFPFQYTNTTKFTIWYWSIMSFGFLVPFVACEYQQQRKAKAWSHESVVVSVSNDLKDSPSP